MEGFKETHNEGKLFFKYRTVLLLCKYKVTYLCGKSQNTPRELSHSKCLEWGCVSKLLPPTVAKLTTCIIFQ